MDFEENHRDSTDDSELNPGDKEAVESELDDLKKFAKSLTMDDVKTGNWFEKLVQRFMVQYATRVDANYFSTKYPGLPADAVVTARLRLATRYAAVEGAASAAAYTGAVAATIGSGGGGSPLTLPAAGVALVVDLLYMSNLQLKLAYDIAVLYRVPLDLDDPEDLWNFVQVAFTIKGGEVVNTAWTKGIPVVIRPIVRKIFSGPTLLAVRSFPVVGKHLLQRTIIKIAIPVVGVPVSSLVNYWSTKIAGRHAIRIFRLQAAINEAAVRMVDSSNHLSELLWVCWIAAKADGVIRESESYLLREVVRHVTEREPLLPALKDLESTINVDTDRLWTELEGQIGDLAGVYSAGVTVAAVDGKIHAKELQFLQKLADSCAVQFEPSAIKREARERWGAGV